MKLKILLPIGLLLLSFLLLGAPALAKDIVDPACQGQAAKSSPVCTSANPQNDPLVHTIQTAATLLASATAVAAVIFIIIGGFNLITSGGNPEMVKKGRERIIYSLIGVAVAALAWTITKFITEKIIQ